MARTQYVPEGVPVTPFNGDEEGLAYMDSHEGLAQKNSRMWQLIALASMSSFFLSLGICLWAAHQPMTVPVIITVNDEGRANFIGKADNITWSKNQIPEIHKQFQIETLINGMFRLYADPEARDVIVKKAENIVQQGAASELNKFFRTNNPFYNIGKFTSIVDIETPLKQTSDTYITYFTVIYKSMQGIEIDKKRWSILTTLGYYKISVNNPLGVYITNYDLQEIQTKK